METRSHGGVEGEHFADDSGAEEHRQPWREVVEMKVKAGKGFAEGDNEVDGVEKAAARFYNKDERDEMRQR